MGWSEADVPDQRGRTVVVTGANSGLGYETTRVLADRGATVVMACRGVDRGADAAREIRAEHDRGTLAVAELDLADLSSVRTFPDRLATTGVGAGDDAAPEIDALINNAGVMAIPRRETADGFETQFGVNHLGHFALTGVLLDSVGAGGRVVTVSSAMHRKGELDFADLQGERSYNRWDAYAQSKLANVSFAAELDRRLEAAGREVTSVAVHPGYADTEIQTRAAEQTGSALQFVLARAANALFAQSAAKGALPTLYTAAAPDVEGGAYYGPGGPFGMRGAPTRQQPAPQAEDRETARRLWRVSTELTGVSFGLEAAAVGDAETG